MTRDELLDALETAVTEWSDRRTQELQDEVAFLRSVFDGRTDGGRLADYVTQRASALVVDSINDLLTGAQ